MSTDAVFRIKSYKIADPVSLNTSHGEAMRVPGTGLLWSRHSGQPLSLISSGGTFVAIDVETANSDPASICAFGYALFVGGRLATAGQTLVRPPAGHDAFSPMHTRIHGITAADVRGKPAFAAVMRTWMPKHDDLPWVAHNASFDASAVRRALKASGVAVPDILVCCSLRMSRYLLELSNNTLPNVAAHLGLRHENHHEAGSDALLCANITSALMVATQSPSVAHLCQQASGSRALSARDNVHIVPHPRDRAPRFVFPLRRD